MARPSKFTADRRKTILSAIAAGNTRKAAAQCAGISYDTLLDWAARGERYFRLVDADQQEAKLGDAPEALPDAAAPDEADEFLQFFQDIKLAEAQFQIRNVQIIQKAAKGGELIRHVIKGGDLLKRVTKTLRDGTKVEEETFAVRVEEKIFTVPNWAPAAWLLERRADEFRLPANGQASAEDPGLKKTDADSGAAERTALLTEMCDDLRARRDREIAQARANGSHPDSDAADGDLDEV